MYHYTESGLGNVWLRNGFTVHKTPYGDGIAIDNLPSLH
ncbi:transcriptional regulator, partial [Xylella fastidiosa subsp. fastidiosa]